MNNIDRKTKYGRITKDEADEEAIHVLLALQMEPKLHDPEEQFENVKLRLLKDPLRQVTFSFGHSPHSTLE
jgi:hypothetical protein